MKKDCKTGVFLWNCANFLRTPILKKIRERLLLKYAIEALVGPRPTEGPIKSPLSVCPSVRLSTRQLGVFLRNGSIVFADFLYDGR